jgi:pimeloyl-ACP methyl ester carboxylesterase
MPISDRDETKELDALTRKEASGSFLQLTDGFTHYELSNPGAQETVVLVHGFSVPQFIFEPTFTFLTEQGFRVLRYDLYGRGFSDRPDKRYDIDLYVGQLANLLDALEIREPVSLVGLSMGGPITATFTVRFPQRVRKLVLIDPVGAKSFPLARWARAAALPGLGEFLIGVVANIRLAGKIASSQLDAEHIGKFGQQYVVQMRYKGFKRALLSTIRSNLLEPCLDVYQQIGRSNLPVLLLWGRHDRTVPFRHSDTLREAIPGIEFHAIEDSGHIPHFEKPEMVNPLLLRFLRG